MQGKQKESKRSSQKMEKIGETEKKIYIQESARQKQLCRAKEKEEKE